MKRTSARCALFAAVVASMSVGRAAAADEPQRITNLYDAFGVPSGLTQDWGFAALIEYGGKRVLFDTGNDAAIFEHNVRQLGVDLARLDAVVISHRHGDHTSGLKYLLEVNPRVPIYTPLEGAYFKGALPPAFLARAPGLPQSQQYFGGKEPARWATGSPWEAAKFHGVAATTEILPGFFLLSTKSQKAGTMDMNELSLAVRTPRGLAVVVGCSHPGVENILAAAAGIDATGATLAGTTNASGHGRVRGRWWRTRWTRTRPSSVVPGSTRMPASPSAASTSAGSTTEPAGSTRSTSTPSRPKRQAGNVQVRSDPSSCATGAAASGAT